MTFDDNAFAITSAIPRAAAIPMYNGERGTDAKNTFKTGFGGRSRLSFRQSINFGVLQATLAKWADIDKQESKLVPLDLQTFIDFIVFLLGIRLCTDFTLLRQP